MEDANQSAQRDRDDSYLGKVTFEEAGVDVEGDRWVAMTELLLDLPAIGSLGSHQRGAGMSKVMWGDFGKVFPATKRAWFHTF